MARSTPALQRQMRKFKQRRRKSRMEVNAVGLSMALVCGAWCAARKNFAGPERDLHFVTRSRPLQAAEICR